MPRDIENLGKVGLLIEVRVTMAEMKNWAPERIAALFAGLAQAIRAKEGK